VCALLLSATFFGNFAHMRFRDHSRKSRLTILLLASTAATQLACGPSAEQPPKSQQAHAPATDSALDRDLAAASPTVNQKPVLAVDTLSTPNQALELARLKKKFVFKADKIYGGGWYTHRSQTVDDTFNRTYLYAPVNDKGDVYLETQYYGDDWIFHTQVVVRIGSDVLESASIPSYDPAISHDNSGGSVWEHIAFTDGRDHGILEAIARNADKPILVRLVGKYDKEFSLSARDKYAIRDSFELAILLRHAAL
jgi:hypothetical protein